MRAKEFVTEIDYSSGLQDLSISDQHLIAKSKIIGEIDGQDVHSYRDENQTCYFFAKDNKVIAALILVLNGRLRAIKNFTGQPGAITALVAFYTHVLKNKLVMDRTEQLTDSGIKWLCSLIRAGGRGLKLTDQTGKYPNADMLYSEWEKAMTNENGPTSIIIESNIKRVLYNRGDLLMIPTRWIGESYDTYERINQMRAREFITEGKNHPVIVVDVQPEYSEMNDGYENPVFEKIISFVNSQTGPVLMFVNAENHGLSGDTVNDVMLYWEDSGFDPRNWRRVEIVDKGYGYLRSWMERGTSDRTIIKVIREMYQQKVNDSRELFGGELSDSYDDSMKNLMGSDYTPYDLDDSISVNWTSISQLKRFSGAYIVGGGRNECLREVELLMNAFNIKYKRIDSMVYG